LKTTKKEIARIEVKTMHAKVMHTLVKESKRPNGMIFKLLFSILLYAAICAMSAILLCKIGLAYLVDNISFAVGMSVMLATPSILYLKWYYEPIKMNNIDKKTIAHYIFIGIIVTSILNYPHNVISGMHNKPDYYYSYINDGLYARALFILILVVIAPVIEEIYCRYYAYNIVKDRLGIKAGVIISSLLYMIFHWELSLLLFLFGVIFALIYEKTKKIWASMIVHGAMNLIWFTLVYFA
jgi:membrane protease YdiL (CAAX protease family)